MICSPKPGQVVQVWYRASVAAVVPLHGQLGRVAIRSKGPGPRNHGVVIGDTFYVLQSGNLRPPR